MKVSRRQVVRGTAGAATGWAALALAGCGPGGAPGPATKAPVKFSFWNARAFGPMEEKLASLYQEKNPNVTVEYVEAAKQGVTGTDAEQVNQLIVRATAGGVLDIAKVEASRVPFALWTRKAILSLKKFGGDKVALNLLNTPLMNFAGDTWSLTQEASVRGLSYSAVAFKNDGLDPDKPPQSWEQVVSYGQRLTKAPDRYAYIFPINNLFKTLDQIWMNNGDIFDRQYLPTKATFTRPEVLEVYQFQYDMVHKYGISPSTAVSNGQLTGAVVMSYDDASNTPANRAKQPEADFRVVKMFRQKEATPCYSARAGSGLVLFASSQTPEAAAEYMKWLVSEEVQRIHAFITPIGVTMEQVGTSGIFPGHKKVAAEPYWDNNPLVKGMNSCVTGIKAAAMSPVFTEVNALLSQTQVDIIAKKISVRDGIGDAQRQAQAMLDSDVQQNRELYATAK